MRKILDIKVGDIHGDLICIGIIKENGHTKYTMKCLKCGREKNMLSSTIRLKKGINHSACGKGLKLKNKTFYERWQSMRFRTTNPNYDHYDCYGGRGINSDEFEHFIDFYDSMFDSFVEKANEIGEKNVSLDRIDPDGNYTKDNCRWIHKNDQPKNQRRTVDFIAIFPDGHEEVCRNVREFAKTHNLDDQSIRDCISGKFKQHKNYKFRRL